MNTQHKPGPWNVTGRNGFIYIEKVKTQEEHEANTRLIAAAPELLGLVKRMQQTIELMRMGHREEPAEKSVLAAADRILSQINE